MPYWDHEEKITRSVFTMDRMFSFYVKTHYKDLQRFFFQAFWTILPPVPRKPCMGSKRT